MKHALKSILSLLIVFVLLTGALPRSNALLSNTTYLADYMFDEGVNAGKRADLFDYLYNEADFTSGLIDISAFRIPYSTKNITALKSIMFGMFTTGYVGDREYVGDEYIDYIKFEAKKADEITAYEAEAEKMLIGIKGNSSLTEMQKALMIHDRLVSANSYAEGSHKGQTIYEALVENKSVCAGYARAYMYLCNKAGLECYYMTGDGIAAGSANHAWDIIFIGGVPYYVDCTWDDNTKSQRRGYAGHTYFLNTEDNFNHSQYYYDPIPEVEAYDFDGLVMSRICSENILTDGVICYVKNVVSSVTELCVWGESDSVMYINKYGSICSNGKDIFVGHKDEIRKFDISAGALGETVWTVSEEDKNEGLIIIGVSYKDGKFLIDLGDKSVKSAYSLTALKSYEFPYDEYEPSPIITVRCTNTFTDTQSVILEFSDMGEVTKYYWGKDPVCKNNPSFDLCGERSKTVEVRESGTYYAFAEDSKGVISEAGTVSFDNTVFGEGCGSLTGKEILTVRGRALELPEPVFDDEKQAVASWKSASGDEITVNEAMYRKFYIPSGDTTLVPAALTTVRKGCMMNATTENREERITWRIDLDDPTGTIYFEGCGIMKLYQSFNDTPWAKYAGYIKNAVIGEGIRNIGNVIFYNCKSLETVTVPKTLTEVRQNAFKYAKKLTDVYYNGTEDDFLKITVDERGNDYFKNSVLHTVSSVLPGDVNGDGEVSSSDSRILKLYIVGRLDDGDINIANADVNGDGEVNARDSKPLKLLIVS